MNPFDLDATGLLVWGVTAHAVADWLLQNDWMSSNKAKRMERRPASGWNPRPGSPREFVTHWWDRHPAAYVHAGIHGVLLAFVFGWLALPLALAHLVIDTRVPVAWFSKLIRQTQPMHHIAVEPYAADPERRPYSLDFDSIEMKMKVKYEGEKPTSAAVQENLEALMKDMREWTCPVLDIGSVVRLFVDQVWHVACIAAAALIVVAL